MSKLQILNGTTSRGTSLALSMLTGRLLEPMPIVTEVEFLYEVDESEIASAPVLVTAQRHAKQYAARTVYLSESHLRDIDAVIESWQHIDSKRVTRSAVLRRAVEYLRDAVEADPATYTLENE